MKISQISLFGRLVVCFVARFWFGFQFIFLWIIRLVNFDSICNFLLVEINASQNYKFTCNFDSICNFLLAWFWNQCFLKLQIYNAFSIGDWKCSKFRVYMQLLGSRISASENYNAWKGGKFRFYMCLLIWVLKVSVFM